MLGLSAISETPLSAVVTASTTSGGITGAVTTAGTPVVGAVVRLYLSADGSLVASTTTNGSGVYGFSGLALSVEAYFVLAFDSTGTYNIGRLDRLTAGF